jgi:hypothetical protein
MINSHKNRMPNCTSSCGYMRKIQDWEWDEEQLTQSGVTVYTFEWDARSVRFLRVRGLPSTQMAPYVIGMLQPRNSHKG